MFTLALIKNSPISVKFFVTANINGVSPEKFDLMNHDRMFCLLLVEHCNFVMNFSKKHKWQFPLTEKSKVLDAKSKSMLSCFVCSCRLCVISCLCVPMLMYYVSK